jgi:SAM-dependent methyltransferase
MTSDNTQIRFEDGAGYERFMGGWSQLVGGEFLDWLGLANGLRWLDVGCGNGAFTQMIVDRCAPATVEGIDPSPAQLDFARTRITSPVANFTQADAMALPFGGDTFDVAVMPLVIFFVPEPARGVAEMARVVRAGGTVAAYAWDMPGGGFPYDAVQVELRELGMDVPAPPHPEASGLGQLRDLWTGAGLSGVETREIAVQHTFDNFEDYWATLQSGPSFGRQVGAMESGNSARLRERLQARMTPDAAGRITVSARANAVRGRV